MTYTSTVRSMAKRGGRIALGLLALSMSPPTVSLAAEESSEALTVAVKPAAPFVMQDESGQWHGITIDLWKQVASNLEVDYTFAEHDLAGLFDAVATGDADVGLGALTVTAAREERVDFSHPFFRSGLAIAVTVEQRSLVMRALDRLFSMAFLKALAALAGSLVVAGGILWLLERRRNPEQFGKRGVRGLGEGIWWAGVTMTTVGYGDKAPQTLGGRVVALIWMYISVITISGFTAAIATSLTVDEISTRINGPSDLGGKAVGTVGGSTSEAYLRRYAARIVRFETAPAALAALAKSRVEAVVYDEPLLRYYLTQAEYPHVRILPGAFDPQSYSIAVGQDSPLREAVNRELLQALSQPEWVELQAEYLGSHVE